MKSNKFTYIKRGLIMALVAISGFSCTELEDTNYSAIVSEDFTTTEDDVAALLASAYINWRETFLLWNGVWRAQEATADEIIYPGRPNGWVDGGIYKRMHQHTWLNQDDIVYQPWYRTYQGITNSNKLLYQIETDVIPMDEEQKNRTLAELRVLRASYYYIIMDIYGKSAYSIDWMVEDGFLPEELSREETYDFIVSEITENIDLLSEENNQEYYGRFNKWAAYTLLAKIYLNAEVYTGTAHWEDCIAACDEVINSGAYALEANQKNVFATENENSVEIIFGLAIDGAYTTQWNQFDIHMQTLQPSNQSTYELTQSPWGGMCATPQFIDTFDPDDSRLTQNFIYGQQYSSSGQPLNCALGAYTGEPLNYINEVPSIDASEAIHGYRFGKFEIAMGSNNILSNDFPVFRYADILMMKAESLLRTGNADAAATLVTQVRERAFATTDPSKAIVTGAELMEGSSYDYGLRDENQTSEEGGDDIQYGRFLDELAWEFNQEGRRRQDMIRFGAFTSKSWFSHSASDEDKQLFPIPQQILLTNGNLNQNPGY